ncbi:MAG: hypothetical protein JWR67_1048 [Mucilaginibacter sp.]|nr:hypothetical protein [Mucilaginibacter sp.]
MSVSMLCEQLVKTGISITVFTTTANGADELSVKVSQPVEIDGVTVIYFKRLTKDHTHFSPSLLIRLWKEARNFDLIHIHAWWNLVSVLSCLFALIHKVPVIISARGTLSSYSFSNKNTRTKNILHNLLGKHLLNKSHFHVTTKQEKQAILKLIQPKSITTISNLVKLPIYKTPKENETVPYLRLIFFSRIEEKKGLDILLNALPLVTVPYHLTIAGSGEDTYIDHLKTIAAKNNINNKITWAGFHTENKFDLLCKHDLFVLPSYDENFGNTVIESLSTGTPVLIGQNVGLADYVINTNLGWLCEITPVSISNAINLIATDKKNDLDRIREQAPSIIYKDFAPLNLVQQYVTMYKQIIVND